MSEQKTMTQILSSQRVIAFNPIFAIIADDVIGGLMLSQLCYWSERASRKDGWFYKSHEDWKKEACLTRKNLETARKNLEKLGVISYQLMGIPATGHYRVNYLILEAKIKEVYSESLEEKEENSNKINRLPDSCKQDRPIRANKVVRNVQSITESTQEIKQRVNTNTSYGAEKESAQTSQGGSRAEFDAAMKKLGIKTNAKTQKQGQGEAQAQN